MQRPLEFRNPLARFQLPGDRQLFDRIVQDMEKNGGDFAPSSHWDWNLGKDADASATAESGYTAQLYDEKYSRLDLMLGPWIGSNGMKPIDEAVVAQYEEFLRGIDHLGLLPPDILAHGKVNDWRGADLGSVLDANLITGYLDAPDPDRRTRIFEVGGGYGRLAEVLMDVIPGDLHYVLVDAVPGSLMYAYLYLKNQFPQASVGFHYLGDEYSTEYDIYILPAWRVDELPCAAFDLCVNVESLQEMEQHHVDHYLALFDRLTAPNGMIYLSNSREYVFRGEWNYPPHWEILFFQNTPRSWTADHPTQIIRKRADDHSREQAILEGAYRGQIAAWRAQKRVAELEANLAERDRICDLLQLQVNTLSAQLHGD